MGNSINTNKYLGISLRGIIGPSTDADAAAFITAAGITNSTQQSAINTLVLNLKSYSLWTKMKAIYPFVGGTATTHKYNLKDPRDLDAAFRILFNGGWTHSANGIQGNGINGYADTKLNMDSANFSINSVHGSVYIRNNITSNVVMGVRTPAFDRFFEFWPRATSNVVNIAVTNGDFYVTGSNSNSTGFYIGRRNDSTTINLWKNNAELFSGSSVSSNVFNNYSFYLEARSDANVASNYSKYEIAFTSIGGGLTDTEAANLYTAVQAFQTTLGRQV